MDIWQPMPIASDTLYQATLGPLTISLIRRDDELHVATTRMPETERPDAVATLNQQPGPHDPALDWSRYILGRRSTTIRLRPILPDRSFVARPETPVSVPPAREATFYISVPISIVIEQQAQNPVTLTEIQSIPLSSIWFGDPTDGELCYSLTTRARRVIDETERRPHRALCALRVENASDEPLDVKRLRVHAPHLGLYDDGARLWTNRISARFHSVEKGSEVEVESKPPAKGLIRISDPRTPIRGSVFTRIFGKFRGEELNRA